MSRYAAALDFGSSKVALAIGEKLPSGIRIVSYHDAESAGIECGEIVTILLKKQNGQWNFFYHGSWWETME